MWSNAAIELLFFAIHVLDLEGRVFDAWELCSSFCSFLLAENAKFDDRVKRKALGNLDDAERFYITLLENYELSDGKQAINSDKNHGLTVQYVDGPAVAASSSVESGRTVDRITGIV